jgi:hypothetical protein
MAATGDSFALQVEDETEYAMGSRMCRTERDLSLGMDWNTSGIMRLHESEMRTRIGAESRDLTEGCLAPGW